MPPVAGLSLREYAAFTAAGDQLGDHIRGHELDDADPGTFRVYRVVQGQRVCVAVLNRQHVAGLIDVTEAEPAG